MQPETQADANFVVRARYLSAPRLEPYLAQTNGNLRDAFALYHWNVDFSAALYEALHIVEVVVRNAIDEQLRAWNITQRHTGGKRCSSDWLTDPSPLLRRIIRRDGEKAFQRAQRAAGSSRPIAHADVIAHTTFGLWRYLVPQSLSRDAGRALLWRESVAIAFVNAGKTSPEQLARSLRVLHAVRNRIAHLEPLLAADAHSLLRHIRLVLAAIDPTVEEWLVSRQRITEVSRQKRY